MSNFERATLDFGIILEEKKTMNGKVGTVFFASVNRWNAERLEKGLTYPVQYSKNPVRHVKFGIGYPVFVPN